MDEGTYFVVADRISKRRKSLIGRQWKLLWKILICKITVSILKLVDYSLFTWLLHPLHQIGLYPFWRSTKCL